MARIEASKNWRRRRQGFIEQTQTISISVKTLRIARNHGMSFNGLCLK